MNPQDSKSDLDTIEQEVIRKVLSPNSYIVPEEGVDLVKSIEAYVTTRVKEAEQISRIKHKLDELSLVPEHPDADLKVYKENRRNELRRIAALTTTTNGKENTNE